MNDQLNNEIFDIVTGASEALRSFAPVAVDGFVKNAIILNAVWIATSAILLSVMLLVLKSMYCASKNKDIEHWSRDFHGFSDLGFVATIICTALSPVFAAVLICTSVELLQLTINPEGWLLKSALLKS